jgi:peptidoglycan/LPS O-acetylase OafA/YrhL
VLEPYGQAVIFDKSAQWLGKPIWELHNLVLAVLLIPLVDHNVRGSSTPRDRKLGDMSYALYLAHWCALLLFRAHWGMAHAGDDALELLAFVVCSCAAGWIVYELVDARCEPLRRAWLRRQSLRPWPGEREG